MSIYIKHQVVKFSDGKQAYSIPDLALKNGCIYWLSGSNGAGKTTLLKYLKSAVSTFSKATFVAQDYKNYIFPYKPIWWNISLEYVIEGEDHKLCTDRAKEISKIFDFKPSLDKKAHNLSGGESQLVLLMRAFSSNPSILLIDEPLSGLDSSRRLEVFKYMKKMTSKGICILYTSHIETENKAKIINTWSGLNSGILTLNELD